MSSDMHEPERMRRRALARTLAGLTSIALLAACGADDREMQRPSPDQTTTTLVRGTTTTLVPPTTVPLTTVPPTSAG
jgi:uncharacterized lipoprotein